MALVFSRVTVTANNESESLLVGGIPRTHQDLEGWVLYDTFLDMLNEDANISVHGQIYTYGEGEPVDATPEEVAYLMTRMNMRPDFLETRCTKVKEYDFSFDWSPFDTFDNPFIEY